VKHRINDDRIIRHFVKDLEREAAKWRVSKPVDRYWKSVRVPLNGEQTGFYTS
jgi:hypothetical protein